MIFWPNLQQVFKKSQTFHVRAKESPASHTLEMNDLVLLSFSFHLGMVIDMVVASMFLTFGFQAFIFFISGIVILIILC